MEIESGDKSPHSKIWFRQSRARIGRCRNQPLIVWSLLVVGIVGLCGLTWILSAVLVLPDLSGSSQGAKRLDIRTSSSDSSDSLDNSSTNCLSYDMADPNAMDPNAIEERLRADVGYLASDALGGRGVGTQGIEQAAKYIAEEFDEAGLQAGLDSDTPFQEFHVSHRLVLGSDNRASFLSNDDKPIVLVPNSDFTPLRWSRPGTFDLPLVLVGYGITDDALGYDDYAGIDVRQKAVVVLRREPQQDDPKSVFNGLQNTDHAYLTKKVANAVAHGAGGIIFCTDHHTISADPKNALEHHADDEALLNFAVRGKSPVRDVPIVHCRRAMLEPLIEDVCGRSLASIEQEIDETLTPRSALLKGYRIQGEISIATQRRSMKNVVGILPGNGTLAAEAIVVGGHYDHLGSGGISSRASWKASIHNGADDNASGTAILIELARRLQARNERLGRQIVFVAFSAEEIGLVGSEHYVRHPLVSLDKTVAMLNLDMLGRLRNESLIVYGVNTADTFAPLVSRLGQQYGLRVVGRSGGYGPSDHSSFWGMHVPVMHFFTGLHSDYHRPQDDANTLNYPGMCKITQMLGDVLVELANAPVAPKRRANSLAFGDMDLSISSTIARSGSPKKPYLGIINDSSHQQTGYRVRRVVKRSPAEVAGMRSGDTILKLSATPINQAGDLVTALMEIEPGENIPTVIQRQGQQYELMIVVGRR